jgi:hypothetical protein
MSSDHKKTDTISTANKSNIEDTITKANFPQTKLSVIVLPPYDVIANAGISPDIQKYLETEISRDTTLTLIKFPYKQLMNIPYQNVFDRKFCKPIIDKVKADIIVMSKLDQVTRTGKMTTDKWNFQIRIYNTNNENQTNSSVTADNLTESEIKNILSDRQHDLTTEIKNSR